MKISNDRMCTWSSRCVNWTMRELNDQSDQSRERVSMWAKHFVFKIQIQRFKFSKHSLICLVVTWRFDKYVWITKTNDPSPLSLWHFYQHKLSKLYQYLFKNQNFQTTNSAPQAKNCFRLTTTTHLLLPTPPLIH